jgi:regulatory protein
MADREDMADGTLRPRDGRRQAPVRVPTAAELHEAALRYLERYSASQAMVARVLGRRTLRAVRAGLIEAEAAQALIAQVVSRLAASGAVDDRRFAEGRAASLLRRGRSPRAVAMDLGQRGIDSDGAAGVLAELAEDGDPAEAAAWALARRRRLGPFRRADREAHRMRDLGIMARAGFERALATAVIDGEPPD